MSHRTVERFISAWLIALGGFLLTSCGQDDKINSVSTTVDTDRAEALKRDRTNEQTIADLRADFTSEKARLVGLAKDEQQKQLEAQRRREGIAERNQKIQRVFDPYVRPRWEGEQMNQLRKVSELDKLIIESFSLRNTFREAANHLHAPLPEGVKPSPALDKATGVAFDLAVQGKEEADTIFNDLMGLEKIYLSLVDQAENDQPELLPTLTHAQETLEAIPERMEALRRKNTVFERAYEERRVLLRIAELGEKAEALPLLKPLELEPLLLEPIIKKLEIVR